MHYSIMLRRFKHCPCQTYVSTDVSDAVSDSLDDILNESGDEEEQDAIVSQVLDEIGIEISGKVLQLNKS